jgi:alpha-L-fucosidase
MTTRRRFLAASAGVLALPRDAMARMAMLQERPRPSVPQLQWQRDELALFLHFGVNTFTDREWGDGKESPAIFNPTRLDARQWATAAREAGFRAMVLTAKHHDGFCLWPTKTTKHSVESSPFRGGQGDVVREFVDACRAEGLRAGLYCSPWDRNHPSYGDSPKYNDIFCDQITELLTNYGDIHEVWFDGANGEGPNGKKQVYDFPRFWSLVKQLQPNSVIFSDAGPDVRWIGNERGVAGETNWSTVDPRIVPVPGLSGAEVMRSLTQGDRDGTVWRPGETDVSIRRGWFYHAAEDARVKSVDQLVGLYFTSVGRNSKLLLNVPPMPDGLLHETDVARLAGMRARLNALFAVDLAKGVRPVFRQTGDRQATIELDLGRTVGVGITALREDIERGQNVAAYVIEGANEADWTRIGGGTTIGYCKLDRLASPAQIRRLRVTLDCVGTPREVSVGIFGGP